jgi:hypothetical protein
MKIPDGQMIQFGQEATFENFISQFQLFSTKLLCVIDGTCLRYYDNKGALPTNIRFDYKQRRGKLTEYYFRDIGSDTLYCVFGREAAKIMYPRIDEVDPTGIVEHEMLLNVANNNGKNIANKDAVLAQCGKSHDNSPTSACKPKRPPIIQAVKPTLPTVTREAIRPNTSTRIIPNRGSVPDNIVIIDKGVRLTFPNPNYSIEVKTYYP